MRVFPALVIVLAAPALAAPEYEVFPRPFEYPDDGPREVVVDPAADGGVGSPFGWHDVDGVAGAEYTVTRGNNAYVYPDTDGDGVPDGSGIAEGGPGLLFAFPLDLAGPPSGHLEASGVNAFYWMNVIHDILYTHGFDEAAGNFQANTYGRGGAGDDAWTVEIQSGSFTNGITVIVPPDGQAPLLRLALFTLTSPARDTALSSWVLGFGYGRGVAARLVGGPDEVGCLGAAESSVMWAGWADWLGLVLTADAGENAVTTRGVGTYIFGQAPDSDGIRPAPYTTDFAANDLTYGSLVSMSGPLNGGSVWATMLWEVYWELVDAYGFNADLYGDFVSGGNNLALRLVLDAMALTPCDPGLVDGRDALLAADEALTGGENCARIWTAFARRGLGLSAAQGSAGSTVDGVEAFDVPDCGVVGVPGAPSAELRPPVFSLAPSPVGDRAHASLVLSRAGHVRAELFDVGGRRVRSLLSRPLGAGRHGWTWELGGVSSGVYFLRLVTPDGGASHRVVVE